MAELLRSRKLSRKLGSHTTTSFYGRGKGSGRKGMADGVKVWLKGESPTYDSGLNSPYYERAAYLVDRMLGLDVVPPTVLKIRRGGVVSAQLFIKGIEGGSRCIEDGEVDTSKIRILDYIIGNRDRHGGNWLVDNNGRAWAIDNALGFSTYIPSGRECDLRKADKRKLKARLKKILANTNAIYKKLDGLLNTSSIDALVQRMENCLKVLGQ